MDNIPEHLNTAAAIVGYLAMIAAVVPNPQVKVGLIILRKLLDFAAMNWGQAENKRTEPKPKIKRKWKDPGDLL